MRLIGSRTGGYEYWVRLKSGLKTWFGQRKNSDTDILLPSKKEQKPEGRFDIFYGEPYGPYIEDNRLVMPKNYDYLMFSLCSKFALKNKQLELYKNHLSIAEVLDKHENKVGEIYLDYAKIPMMMCKIAANASKRFNLQHPDFFTEK